MMFDKICEIVQYMKQLKECNCICMYKLVEMKQPLFHVIPPQEIITWKAIESWHVTFSENTTYNYCDVTIVTKSNQSPVLPYAISMVTKQQIVLPWALYAQHPMRAKCKNCTNGSYDVKCKRYSIWTDVTAAILRRDGTHEHITTNFI